MQCPASQVPTLLLVPIFYSIQRSDVGFVCGTPRRAQIAPRCINESITCYCFWLQLEAEEKRRRRKEWESPPCLRMWPPLSPKKKTHTHTPEHAHMHSSQFPVCWSSTPRLAGTTRGSQRRHAGKGALLYDVALHLLAVPVSSEPRNYRLPTSPQLQWILR